MSNLNISDDHLIGNMLAQAQAEKVDTCDMTLQEHTQSLLHNIEDLHQDKLFSDLQIFCDDGIVQSYR